MSAMTGTRSPTSPWSPEPPNLQLAGSSTPAALLSMRDTHPSPLNSHITPQNPGSDLSSPNYFSISIDDANLARNRDSITYPQHQIISPKSQFLPKKPKYENIPDAATSGTRVDVPRASTASTPWCGRGFQKEERPLDRRGTLPSLAGVGSAISVERCAELLKASPDDIMLFDVRPFTHFLKGSIKGSLNLCIPTTLLKRPSFDTQKLANTFTSDADKKNFARWRNCRYLVAYDAHTSDMKDAGSLTNVLRKFILEGWTGEGMILLGGFNAFSDRFPSLIQRQNQPVSDATSMKSSPMELSLPSAAPVAGGCALPESASVTIPFFSNIRQNMDLVSGVGQIPLQLPETLTEPRKSALPSWLRDVSDSADKGQIVSQKFLELEQKELERMKQALSYDKNASSNSIVSPNKFRVAGIEKGTKNRYNDIYPFDHSRVKLQDVAPGGCDYVNANFLKADYSEKRYIATQAPVPDTFNDFWRVIWEQDARLIVSLTAEVERGQVKCHPYWESGSYGPLKVNNFSQKKIYLNPADSQQINTGSRAPSPEKSEDPSRPYIIARYFGLSHSAFPFQPLREITQLHYPYWPDFGTTSQPVHLLRLIEECDKVIDASNAKSPNNHEANSSGQRPIVVHCSAGCGRTGTFCTVDSVLDILKRQHAQKSSATPAVPRNEDLIERSLADFRTQRPSMVQNLSQYVLCYESVLEWFTSHMAKEESSQ